MQLSIIIPSYNRAQLLYRTLTSINQQTSSEWECIVVDDFSNDNTKDVVSSFAGLNPRFSYYVNSHKKGAQGARNTGVDHAKFDWVIFFDSDNIMHSNFVEKMMNHITEDIDVLACCSDIVNVETGRTGRIMNPRCSGYIHDKLFTGRSYVDFNQAVIRKSKVMEIGGLDEDCPSMQEWDTHIRLSTVSEYSMISDSLVDYFMGGKDAISSNNKREVIGRLYILKKHIKEWKERPIGLTKFAYQIYIFIGNNNDDTFKKEKMLELKKLVPFLYLRVVACSVYMKITNEKK